MRKRQAGSGIDPRQPSTPASSRNHFAEAADDGYAGKAADYAIAAGREAVRRAAHEQAAEHYRRGREDRRRDRVARAGLTRHATTSGRQSGSSVRPTAARGSRYATIREPNE